MSNVKNKRGCGKSSEEQKMTNQQSRNVTSSRSAMTSELAATNTIVARRTASTWASNSAGSRKAWQRSLGCKANPNKSISRELIQKSG